jgi:hypothetical protein
MDWDNTLKLLPAMGRTSRDAKVVQDLESPAYLGEGFLQQVVNMVAIHEAAELFVIASSTSQTAKDILARISSFRESGRLPASLPIHGLLYDPASYRLELVHSGYEKRVGHEVL